MEGLDIEYCLKLCEKITGKNKEQINWEPFQLLSQTTSTTADFLKLSKGELFIGDIQIANPSILIGSGEELSIISRVENSLKFPRHEFYFNMHKEDRDIKLVKNLILDRIYRTGLQGVVYCYFLGIKMSW